MAVQFSFQFEVSTRPHTSHTLPSLFRAFSLQFVNSDDMYAQDSIDLLTKSGIDFQKHKDYGIDVEHFGELLISSGFVLLDDVKWISFHRYDYKDNGLFHLVFFPHLHE
jgi:hypothetical protein